MKAKQVFNNAKWIIVCKIAQSILQLIVGMLSARYLGPANYGLINYAASIVAFALPIMKLGMDAILVHELVESPEKEGEIMGTSMLMNCVSSILCIGGVSLFACVANFGEIETIVVCVLYSLSVFFAAVEMIQYWFQYKLLSKYPSVIMLMSYFVVSAYKIFLLVTGKNVYWFAVSHSVEYGLIGIILIFVYFKCNGQRFCFSFERAKKMLKKGTPYIFAALMVVVIQNTDHIMLTSMVGKEENGYYSAAITSASVAQFVFTAIIDSFRPLILTSKKENEEAYQTNISRLYCIITYLSIAQNIVFTLFAKWIILLLYGEEYSAAIPVLQILTWYRAFSFMGTIRNIWMLAEEKQKYLPFINLSGVVLNIALNAITIPYFGAGGAAFASLVTQVFINFVLGFIIKPLRQNNILMIRGLSPVFFIKEFKNIYTGILKRKKH